MRKILKKSITLLLAATLALSATACGSKKSNNNSDENNTIKFGILPGTIRTAVVLMADHLGYYKEEGGKC